MNTSPRFRYNTIFYICLFTIYTAIASASERPNLIIIMADDLGFGDLSSYGNTEHQTPNIDQLGENGIMFDNFYVTSSVCTPTRVALLTGRHPARVGFSDLLWPTSDGGLPETERTLPEILQAEGYTTALVGKWHLGHSDERNLPLNHGFDSFYGMPYPNDMGPDHIQTKIRNEEWPPMPMMRDNQIIEAPIDVNLLTQQYTLAATQFIAENHHHPFFLFLAHAMPHTIIGASPDFTGTSGNGLYGDAVQEVDWSVSEVIRTLRTFGLEENTMIVFTSDNGAVLRRQYKGDDEVARKLFPYLTFGTNGPLRGGKQSTFEGGIRVPAFFSWPGTIPAGIKTSQPVSVADIMPTFLDLANIELPDDRHYDGLVVSELIQGKPADLEDRVLFFGRENAKAVRKGKWKLVLPKQPNFIEGLSAKPMLFDLSKDLGEAKDQAAKQPHKVAELLSLIEDWEKHAHPDPIRKSIKTYKQIDETDLSLHIFEPNARSGDSPRSAIVFIHGGGWAFRDPSDFFAACERYAKKGFVSFSVQYRLAENHEGRIESPKTTPIECVKDVRSAVRWIRAHADQYNIAPDKIVVGGHSVGGQLTLATALFDDINEASDDLSISSIPNAMLLYSGTPDTLEAWCDYLLADRRQQIWSISPAHNVRPNMPPAIAFHGKDDPVVPFWKVVRLRRFMTEAGNTFELVPFEGRQHHLAKGDPRYTEILDDEILQKTDTFLTKHGF